MSLSLNCIGENLPGQGQRRLCSGLGHGGFSPSLSPISWLRTLVSVLPPCLPAVNTCIKQPFPFKVLHAGGRRACRPAAPLFGNVSAYNNLIDRDLSPFSLAEVGLLCLRFLPGPPPSPHPHIPTHCGVTDLRQSGVGGGVFGEVGGREALCKVWAWSRMGGKSD